MYVCVCVVAAPLAKEITKRGRRPDPRAVTGASMCVCVYRGGCEQVYKDTRVCVCEWIYVCIYVAASEFVHFLLRVCEETGECIICM